MQDRRSVARNTGLIASPSWATLILLAGLLLVVRPGVPAGHRGGLSPRVGWRIRDACRFPGFAGPAGFGKPPPVMSPPATLALMDPFRRRRRHRRLQHDNDEATAALRRHPRDREALGDLAYPTERLPIRGLLRPEVGPHKQRTGRSLATDYPPRAPARISTTSARPPSMPR